VRYAAEGYYDMKEVNLADFEILGLLGLYADILNELHSREVIRTVNNPAADYAEYLVAKALSLRPAPPSTKGFDAVDGNGIRYEIKARRRTQRSKPTRFSAIRNLDQDTFDELAAVLFNENFSVNRACLFPRSLVQQNAFWQEHVNGWILPISDSLWDEKAGKDITEKLRSIQGFSTA
jgi:hypothetical protein